MQWTSLLALVLVAPRAFALLRFSCSGLVIERFDPLVTPGVVAPHLHQIVGGNGFNITMDPDNDVPSLSTCTTCTFSEDFSNYWTAVMYFRHENGSYKRVPQLPGHYLGNAQGGMTVYYIQGQRFSNYNGKKVTAFKKGFRMIVGDASLREGNRTASEYESLSFRCWSANQELLPHPGEGFRQGLDTHELPNKQCRGGIRAQIYFPTCWDGKNLDSPDHKSHMAFFVNGQNGNCPVTHPVQVPQILLETIWDTKPFNNMWPKDGKQPFVLSMGDPTGAGHHADYLFGWKDDSLQRAMNSCTNVSGQGCTTLKTQSVDVGNRCTQKQRVAEQTEGWLAALPGCNPIQAGPGRANPESGCGAPTTYLP